MNTEIFVGWNRVTLRSSKLDYRGVLYAYTDPDTADILYLGKAYDLTPRQRLKGAHKEAVYQWMEEGGSRKFDILVGQLSSVHVLRLTNELLCDVESLLIKRLRPLGNRHNTVSRGQYWRPGMRVYCIGDWPHRRTGFWDR